jgi:septal ring factor EnvC (AmiA/AmiB activator)
VEDKGGGASRSTEPAFGTSSATDVSLREYVMANLHALEAQMDIRFDAMKDHVEEAFNSSQRAIDKADEATEKRFEGVNEFRAALSDQATRFVTIDQLHSLQDKLEAAIERNRDDLDKLSKRIDLREGAIHGSRLTWGTIVALIASGATLLGAVIFLANYLATHAAH